MTTSASHPSWVELLQTHRDTVLTRWVDVAAATLAGRMTRSELERDCRDIFDGIVAAEGAVRGRRQRARRRRLRRPPRPAGRGQPHPRPAGLHPDRDRRRGLRAQGGRAHGPRGGRRHRGLPRLRRPVPPRRRPRAVHARDLRRHARERDRRAGRHPHGALDPGGQALGRRRRPPARRHAGLRPHPGRHGEPAPGAGGDRLRARHHRHHRRRRGRHPGRPAPAQDRQAARLLGAECIISGIRPQIAQTVVGLGIDFGDISTKSSLADALLLALRESGLDIVSRHGAQAD